MNNKRIRNELRKLARNGKISQLKRELKALHHSYEIDLQLPKTLLSKQAKREMNRNWVASI